MTYAPARTRRGPAPDVLAARRRRWTLTLDAVVVLPLLAAVVSPASRTFSAAVNLAAGIGLVATSVLAVALLLVARVRALTRVFGLELGNHLHRRLGLAALTCTVAHVVAAVAGSKRGWALLDLTSTSAFAVVGIVAVVLLVLCSTVLVPRASSRRYAVVARVHGALALVVLVLVGVHVLLLDRMLTDPVVAVPLVGLAALVVAVVVRRWVVRPATGRDAYTVVGVRPETTGTSTIVLHPRTRHAGPPPEPGQFVWLRMRRDVVTTVEHPFTVAASTRLGALELTFRHRGTFSLRLASLPPGHRVWVDGPHGDFVPAPGPTGLVLVAGGVGITPIMSILRAHAAAGDARAHRLVLAERSDEALFALELESLCRRLDLAILRTEGRRLDPGLLADILPTPRAGEQDYFVCGPSTLVVAALDLLAALGVPPDRVHTEQFA